MEAQAYDYFRRIDELGGMVEAVKTGFPQREIADAAFRYQREVESGERIVVGVNEYRTDAEELADLHRPDPAAEKRQLERLATTRARRNSSAVERSLAELRASAAADRNLMEPLLSAARARASEGEIVAALQEVFGTYTEQPVF
jgi:methylmalonyl-CoA mutase N-terminal domain/subunit